LSSLPGLGFIRIIRILLCGHLCVKRQGWLPYT
jgi:hypothetical protein